MGLIIEAYRKLKPLKNPQLDENGHPVDMEREWSFGPGMECTERFFPGRAKGINPTKFYSWAEKYKFHAGSYNSWRESLATLAGHNHIRDAWEAEDGPFHELINFSAPRCLGWVTAW